MNLTTFCSALCIFKSAILPVSLNTTDHHRSAEMADIVFVFEFQIDIWHRQVRVRGRVKVRIGLRSG